MKKLKKKLNKRQVLLNNKFSRKEGKFDKKDIVRCLVTLLLSKALGLVIKTKDIKSIFRREVI